MAERRSKLDIGYETIPDRQEPHMRGWLIVQALVALTVVTFGLGYFGFKQYQQLKQAKSELANYKANEARLREELNNIKSPLTEASKTNNVAKVISPKGAYLRSGPSANYGHVDVVKFGDTLQVIAESENWLHVRFKEKDGYIHSTLAERVLPRIDSTQATNK